MNKKIYQCFNNDGTPRDGMNWWEFAAPKATQKAVLDLGKQWGLNKTKVYALLEKIATPHKLVELSENFIKGAMCKAYTLQQILFSCLDDNSYFENYEINQPEGADEKDTDGLWDMAGEIALDMTIATDKVGAVQSLLYNLLGNYRVEIPTVEIVKSEKHGKYYLERDGEIVEDEDGNTVYFDTLDDAQDAVESMDYE